MTGRGRLTAMSFASRAARALAIVAAVVVMAVAAPARADLKVGDRLKELDIAVDANGKSFS